ncbi:type II secretion system protein GspG [Campylobacterota bacterium]|nr:type II secretion system protein GspG [Campylobacterota bacterium]
MKLRGGFSLIELMVVVIILGLLSALIVPNVLGRGEQAKQKLTCVNMKNVSNALEMFKQDNGAFPSTENGLEALISNPNPELFTGYLPNGYLGSKQAPKDSWNRPFIYLQEGNGYEIISLGADGKEGGADENRDIKLSECER